jgi:gas vesicle protein
MANLLSWLGKKAQAVVAQVNPADNGRTYSTVMNRGAAYAPKAPAPVAQQLTHSGVSNVVGGAVKPVVQFANTANLAGRQAFDTVRMTAATVSHNPVAFRNANVTAQNDYRRFGNQNSGLAGQGTFFHNPQEAQSGSLKVVVPRIVGGTLQTAATVAPVGGGALAKGSLALRTAKGAVTGAALGGVGTAGNQLVQTGKIDAKSVIKGAATGAALGGATPLVGAAARKAAPVVRQGVQKTAQTAKTARRELDIRTTPTIMNMHPNERYVLSDFADYKAGRYKPENAAALNQLQRDARTAAQKAKLDITSGPPANIQQRISNFLDTYDRQKMAIKQGGYIKIPGGGKNLPDNRPPTQKQLEDAHNSGDVQSVKQIIESMPVKDPYKSAMQSTFASDIKQASTLPAGVRVVQNKLTIGGREGRQNISPEVQAGISGEHAVRSTKGLQDMAAKTADKRTLDETIQQAHSALAVAPGKIDDQTVALAQQAIERADASGRLEDAIAIHDALSGHLVKQGQTIQAASLLYRLSPQGLFYKGISDLKKGGAKVTPELETTLKNQSDAIKNATDQATKERATAQFHKTVADNLPKSALNGAISVWKAGLLSGVKTQGGNFASNATFAGLKAVSNPVSALVDKGLSLATGQRTKTATLRGLPSGAKQGVGTGIDTLRTGIDARNITGNKYEVHGELNFKNPVIQKVFGNPSNLVFRGMNAADQPFYYAALKNNLYDIVKADGINKGLSGPSLAEHVTNMVANPTTNMAETAKLAAEKAVLGQDNKLASSITALTQAHPIAQTLVPFVKVPTNFLSRTLDYSPVGAVKAMAQSLNSLRKGQGIDQRALSEALGEATTGTALIYLGAELANHNLLSGAYPSTDPKEAARWKAEGIQPNSIKVGNTWVSMNYLGPGGLLFGAGKDYHDAAVKGDNATVASIAGAGKNLTGQSFLTGFSGFTNALTDPQRNAPSYIDSQAGSVVPAWLNDIAGSTDSKQREVNGPVDAMKARLPGARNRLPVKLDTYGNPLSQRTDPLNLLANPLRPSNVKTNPVIGEVSRLHNADTNNPDLQVTPLPVKKVVSIEGKQVKLSDAQRHDFQQKSGQYLQQKWGELIKTPEYQALSDAEKAAALTRLKTAASTYATRDFVTTSNLGVYNKPLTKTVLGVANNDSVASFAKSPTKSIKAKAIAPRPASTTKKAKKSVTVSTKAKSVRSTRTARARSAPKALTSGFKTAARIKAPSLPKIKTHRSVSFKAPSIRKIAVSKIPTNYTKRRQLA